MKAKKDENINYYYTNRHAVYLLQYHLVVVTKYRHKVINNDLKDRLIEISYSIIESDWKSKIISINTDEDHVHILFETSPQTQLSKLINNYKTVTSRLIRKEFSKQLEQYYWKPYFWTRSYFIGSVSERTTKAVKNYINNQKTEGM